MANEYELNKLINTVDKQSQLIDVLIRKVEDLTRTITSISEVVEVHSHGH